jgi:hypothetical protein
LNKDQKVSIITGIAFLAYGAWMFAGGLSIRVIGKSGDYGPGFMPRLVGMIVIFLSAMLVFTTWWGMRRNPVEKKTSDKMQTERYDYRSILLSIALLGLYMVTLEPAGFVLSSIVYLFLQMMIIANKPARKQLLLFVLISLIVPVVVNYIFVTVFSLLLPDGILG